VPRLVPANLSDGTKVCRLLGQTCFAASNAAQHCKIFVQRCPCDETSTIARRLLGRAALARLRAVVAGSITFLPNGTEICAALAILRKQLAMNSAFMARGYSNLRRDARQPLEVQRMVSQTNPIGPESRSPWRPVGILDDIRRAIARDPIDARAARLVNLLNLPVERPATARGGLAPWQRHKIEQYLKQHLAEPLPVEQLADQVTLSASYFHHAFKESFGTSPHAYITRLRLQAAQVMMLSTEDPLSQIAFACGFADQSHLCKIFRREQGEPPGMWRRRNCARRAGVAATGGRVARTARDDRAIANVA
jgi:AraC-like DNA-binding protein